MKITVQKIIRDLPLADYAPEMKAYTLHVWVNPDREFIKRFSTIMSTGSDAAAELFKSIDTANKLLATTPASDVQLDQKVVNTATVELANNDVPLSEWYSELLSQGPVAERLGPEDLRELFAQDPALWAFISGRCWEMIDEHRTALQKKRVMQ